MSKNHDTNINGKWIVSNRGKKMAVDTRQPYSWLVEKERTASGKIEDIATIFLTNKECPFHCLMCDLWKNTTDKPVPVGAIPNQIEWALAQMPEVKHLKLYNSGSFFDNKAISEEDYNRIASLLHNFDTVIVESHPKFINEKCLRFRDMIKPELQVAIGLETVHPEVLLKLNKQMTLDDFKTAVDFLSKNRISSRAFVLLRPPFLSESEGVYWAKQSIDFAFSVGVECCIVIPVRAGNGAMELLMESGNFTPPNIYSLETVLEYGIELNSGRVFADVWDLGLFSNCEKCIDKRTSRLTAMNLSQKFECRVACTCDSLKLES
ncbi:MAG: radical SAM protein [Bacteroidetes bacterium]|nr:radical SAM protein [Bacteroidota bacterium]